MKSKKAKLQLALTTLALLQAEGLTETEHVDSHGNRVTRLRDRFGRWASDKIAEKAIADVGRVMEWIMPEEGKDLLPYINPAEFQKRGLDLIDRARKEATTLDLSPDTEFAFQVSMDATAKALELPKIDRPGILVRAMLDDLNANPLGIATTVAIAAVSGAVIAAGGVTGLLPALGVGWGLLGATASTLQIVADVGEFYEDRKVLAKSPELQEIREKLKSKREKDVANFIEETGADSEDFASKTGLSVDQVKEILSDRGGSEYDAAVRAERVREVADMVKDGDTDSDGFKWRTGVLKAESKYGKEVDMAIAPLGRPNELYKKLRKGKTGKPDITTGETSPLNKLFSTYSTKDIDKRLAQPERTPGTHDILRNAKSNLIQHEKILMEVAKMTNVKDPILLNGMDMNEDVMLEGVTGSQGDKYLMAISDLPILVGNAFLLKMNPNRMTCFHEFGHVVEYNAGLASQSFDYLETRDRQRTKFLDKARVKQMHTGQAQKITRSEQDLDGDFNNPYASVYMKEFLTGKVGSTEIVSTGVQSLSDPYSFDALATHDREHLMYTLYAMDSTR